MICPKCGQDAGQSRFCPNCGTPVQSPIPNQQPTNTQPLPYAAPPTNRKRKGGCIKFLLGVLAFFVVILVIAIAARNSKIDSNGASSSGSTVSVSEDFSQYIDRIEPYIEENAAHYSVYFTDAVDWTSKKQDDKFKLSKYAISECETLLNDESDANSMSGVVGILPDGDNAFIWIGEETISYYKDNKHDFKLTYDTGETPEIFTDETLGKFEEEMTEIMNSFQGAVTKYSFSSSEETLTVYVDDTYKYVDESIKQAFADNLAEEVSNSCWRCFDEYMFLDFRYSDGTGFAMSSVWDKNKVNLS